MTTFSCKIKHGAEQRTDGSRTLWVVFLRELIGLLRHEITWESNKYRE